jgi:hypothetical protein
MIVLALSGKRGHSLSTEVLLVRGIVPMFKFKLKICKKSCLVVMA